MVTWTRNSTTEKWSGAVAAVGAGKTLTDGWIDMTGNTWSVGKSGDTSASNYYLLSQKVGTPWLGGILGRPASENSINQRFSCTFLCEAAQTPYISMRWNNALGSAVNSLLVGINLSTAPNCQWAWYRIPKGGLQGVSPTINGKLTLTPGTEYQLDIQLTQDSSGNITTTATVSGMDGRVISSATLTNDSATNSLLGTTAAGIGIGLFANGNANMTGLRNVTTYTGDVAAPAITQFEYDGPTKLTVGQAGVYTIRPGTGSALSSDTAFTPASTVAGTFSPATPTLKARGTDAFTFSFTPSAAGSGTLTLTASNGLTATNNPIAITAAAKPTAISVSLGSSQANVGSPVKITYQLDHPATAPVTISGWQSGSLGSFSPQSVVIPVGSSSGSLMYTGTAAGNATIGSTNNANLTNQNTTLSLVHPVAPGSTIPVNNPAFGFSPGNWYGDTGMGGSQFRRTWNVGAYFVFQFMAGPSPTLAFEIGSNKIANSQLTVFVNGVMQTFDLSKGVPLVLSGLNANVTNTVLCVLDKTDQSARWGQNGAGNTLTITGAVLDAASTPGTAAVGSKGWVQFIGDSITEGIAANNGNPMHTYCYTYQMTNGLRMMGYEVGVNACGNSGFLAAGDNKGDVPAYNSRWDLVDSGVSALSSDGLLSAHGASGTAPVAIICNYGTNDTWSHTTAQYQAALVSYLTHKRATAPDAWLFVIQPFGFWAPKKFSVPAWANATQAAIAQYQAANPTDKRVVLLDIGQTMSYALTFNSGTANNGDQLHPWLLGDSWISPWLLSQVMMKMEGTTAGRSYVFR